MSSRQPLLTPSLLLINLRSTTVAFARQLASAKFIFDNYGSRPVLAAHLMNTHTHTPSEHSRPPCRATHQLSHRSSVGPSTAREHHLCPQTTIRNTHHFCFNLPWRRTQLFNAPSPLQCKNIKQPLIRCRPQPTLFHHHLSITLITRTKDASLSTQCAEDAQPAFSTLGPIVIAQLTELLTNIVDSIIQTTPSSTSTKLHSLISLPASPWLQLQAS